MYIDLCWWNKILIHSLNLSLLWLTHSDSTLLFCYLPIFWTAYTIIIFIETALAMNIFNILTIRNLRCLNLSNLFFWWTMERYIFLRGSSICINYLIYLAYWLCSGNAWIFFIAVILLIFIYLLVIIFLC